MKVKKRNGSYEDFDLQKISNAVKKAFDSLKVPIDLEILDEMSKEVHVFDGISIEQIQDQLEEILIDWGFEKVAKVFKEYRYEHQLIREAKMAKKLAGLEIENQNANVDEHSFGGRIGEATRIITKDYALEHCVSKMAKKNHLDNMIYIHDLDSYSVGMHNCLSIPFDDLLANGFNTRQTDIRPAGSISTAMQLVAVIFQLQSLQQFGFPI